MEYKNIKIFILFALAFVILSGGCSISVTRNYYSAKPKTLNEADSTASVYQLDSQSINVNDKPR